MVDSSATRSASCQVMAEIRDLGRLPCRMKKPVGDAQIAENNLAQRLGKARANQELSKEQEAELERIAGASQPGSEQLHPEFQKSRAKMAKNGAKIGQDGAKMEPRWIQEPR